MIQLQSFNLYNRVAHLDTRSGTIEWFDKRANPPATVHYQGTVAVVDGQILVLYRDGSELIFWEDAREVLVSEESSAKIEKEGDRVFHFKIIENKQVKVDIQYMEPRLDPPLTLDPTPFVEEEDYDFCLFVHNVINNPQRRRRIYQAL